ncbi:GntR family transcriptional regulator [Sphingomonas montanisoli]|uniref:GntR family transcriptional regulator n=1 Tax=Sphingomonas montanisoli TaxID=2606412 RepID=A0A5D9CC00_9SPHN|nr:GntR family transcriptional regulator [Sphingomonas montanisoli]TZG29264.1 GntR family transcriptional regulator [Sphingomonas montanisoli]
MAEDFDLNDASDATHLGASQRVYLGIMEDLEARRMVPGQRLIETDLAKRFNVGRNAVREAIQRLAVRGVIDPSRNKSPAIRCIDLKETLEILDVAAALTGLAAHAAARAFDAAQDQLALDTAMAALENVDTDSGPGHFSRARRQFYRVILSIGGNRELERLFPAIGMHIIYSQFQSPKLQQLRMTDYRAIRDAIVSGNANCAESAARNHVEHVRAIILKSEQE